MKKSYSFEIIVIGGGQAGCEAALAAARRGLKTGLITAQKNQIGAMSCNPAIGGLGKGHIVREIDALGGEMGRNIDETGIQFRKLNTRKGPAVQGTRAQADKYLYKERMQRVISATPNLVVVEGIVSRIKIKSDKVEAVQLENGDHYFCDAIIVTTGTFLNGLCHVGLKNFKGGRVDEMAAVDLSLSLQNDCGLKIERLKTGTVPRLDQRSIDYSKLEEQKGDEPIPFFSHVQPHQTQKQISCYITYTNKKTHDIIRRDIDKSPLFSGVIKGVGPRYCPSIEDKIFRFSDKDRHQIFLEPEGLSTPEIYPNGLSTSLPLETQLDFIHSIEGLQNAKILKAGYAVEYDAIQPMQIGRTYETKNISGLFLAGQINGTTGYEEAAAQGLMASINAANKIKKMDPIILDRSQAYIGVLTDDLISKGNGGEPYRMFTSRAEYRLILREDNADLRLRHIGFKLGLVSEAEYVNFQEKYQRIDELKSESKIKRVQPATLKSFGLDNIKKWQSEGVSLENLIKQPGLTLSDIACVMEGSFSMKIDSDVLTSLVSDIRYAGYINRYETRIKKMKFYEHVNIPSDINYLSLKGLSNEVREKLEYSKPQTLGQALRIPGITPAAVQQIEVYIQKSNPKMG